jgi:hypothetical protein
VSLNHFSFPRGPRWAKLVDHEQSLYSHCMYGLFPFTFEIVKSQTKVYSNFGIFVSKNLTFKKEKKKKKPSKQPYPAATHYTVTPYIYIYIVMLHVIPMSFLCPSKNEVAFKITIELVIDQNSILITW